MEKRKGEGDNNQTPVIISLGGSLIAPAAGLNVNFIREFKKLILQEIEKGRRFVIITGGGQLSRNYVKALNQITPSDEEEQDWLGIHATRMNAHFIKAVFKKYAHPRINKNPRTKENLQKHFAQGEKIMVAAGWRPGWSTDYVATILAERFKAKKLINLSNVEYIFDRDPKKYPQAKKIKKISWTDFRKIVGNKWSPGLNSPFDPIAARLAEKNDLEVAIIAGKNLSSLSHYLNNQPFTGSLIKNLTNNKT